LTTASWPLGIALTSWDYMWRSTPMHRRETLARLPAFRPALLEFPAGVSREALQGQERGRGPLFHRRYRTHIRDTEVSASELIAAVKGNVNRPAPTTFARFQKVVGSEGTMTVGDEYVVRMPGPWDGPVRVIDVSALSFRFATLEGHLEAGQIEFRAAGGDDGGLRFEIESWARSSSWLSNLLYDNLRMAKEIQAHMWISFLEGVVALASGRMTGGVDIETERVVDASVADARLLGPPRVRRRLAQLAGKKLNFDLAALAAVGPGSGWEVTDLCQALPSEPPGMPAEHGSWALARRLMGDYEFADPSIVRAYYDPAMPLEGRDMLLKLQALGVLHLYVGVRVGEVYEQTRDIDGRRARVWGWNYRTLEGHFEIGQMDWEVWKWIDTGEVEFRVHALSRNARVSNPFARLGLRVLRGYERQAFLRSTQRRMRTFVTGDQLERGGRRIAKSGAPHSGQ
jgi:uncharacterized protein (UPF0548 family)